MLAIYDSAFASPPHPKVAHSSLISLILSCWTLPTQASWWEHYPYQSLNTPNYHSLQLLLPKCLPRTTWDKRHLSCQAFFKYYIILLMIFSSSEHQGISLHFCIFPMVISVCVAHPKFSKTGRKLVQNLGKTQEKKKLDASSWLVFCFHHRNTVGTAFGNTEPERLSRTDMAQGQQGHHTLLWPSWERFLHTTTLL